MGMPPFQWRGDGTPSKPFILPNYSYYVSLNLCRVLLVSGKGQILVQLVNNRSVVLVRRLVERFGVEKERVDGVSHLRESLLLLDVAILNLRTDLHDRKPVFLVH